MKIICKLFGTPEVYKDGERIIFPYKKAEALFYFLIIKKQCFRDFVVDMLWGSVDEEVAKKSLRNAVYIINKAFDEDVLVSPKRAIIMLNPEISFESDVNLFLDCCDGSDIKAYTGELLEGFLVKDAEGFDRWLLAMQNLYRDTYISKLQKMIQQLMKEKKLEELEWYCKRLIEVDEFNEKAYRIMMNTYRKLGQYERCMDIYNQLAKRLKDELSITPDIKTNELLSEIVKERSERQAVVKSDEEEFFYGRVEELDFMGSNYERFFASKSGVSVIIEGEAGIGKSFLVSKHLSRIRDSEAFILRANCYLIEENYPLKPWHDILLQLSALIAQENISIPGALQRILQQTFPGFEIKGEEKQGNNFESMDPLRYMVVEKAILEIFKVIANKKRILILFEDIHWMDDMSLKLVQHLLMEDKNHSMLFIATLRKGFKSKLDSFAADAKARSLVELMELERFDRKETIELAIGAMPELKLSEELESMLYEETEGIPFFINEFLHNLKHNKKTDILSQKVQDILKSRFLNVSEEGKKVLNIISCFFNEVTLDELLVVSEKSELELLDILGELEEKNLLREVGETRNVGFVFTHQKLREYIYSQLSGSKKKILHGRIARLLEGNLKGDRRDCILYSRLIHHYKSAGNRLAALNYTIKNLEHYLCVSQEIFPVFSEDNVPKMSFVEMSEEQRQKELLQVSNIISEIRNEEGNSRELDRLELSYMHMIGRGYVWSGQYRKGLAAIRRMTDKALMLGECSFALKGYRQMIYFAINTCNVKLMENHIEEAIKAAEQCRLQGELAILTRLKGMHRVMDGRFAEGEKLLKQSIVMFEQLEEKESYLLNIAAAYNFIGECKRRGKEFSSAIQYYDKAIAICKEKGLEQGLPVISTYAGQTAYDMKDYKRAKVYLTQAVEGYNKLNTLWERSTAYGYMAMLLVKERSCDEAKLYLKDAQIYADLVKSPYEKALLFRTQGEIRRLMDNDPELRKAFADILDKTAAEYCDTGLKLMKKVKCCYESDILMELMLAQ